MTDTRNASTRPTNDVSLKCARCGGRIWWEDQFTIGGIGEADHIPGEYLHDAEQEGIDENHLAYCPGTTEYGYPAPNFVQGYVWWFDVTTGNESSVQIGTLPRGLYLTNDQNFWHGPHMTYQEVKDFRDWNPYEDDRIVWVGSRLGPEKGAVMSAPLEDQVLAPDIDWHTLWDLTTSQWDDRIAQRAIDWLMENQPHGFDPIDGPSADMIRAQTYWEMGARFALHGMPVTHAALACERANRNTVDDTVLLSVLESHVVDIAWSLFQNQALRNTDGTLT